MTDEFNPAPRLADRLEGIIKEARAWSRLTAKKLRFKVASLGLEGRVRLANEEKLVRSIKGRTSAPNLDLQRIAFSFPRHGIFIEHGVGRGRPVGSAKARRYAKPWLKPVLEDEIEVLADLLSNEYADLAADEIRLLIPGIIDTKVQGNG